MHACCADVRLCMCARVRACGRNCDAHVSVKNDHGARGSCTGLQRFALSLTCWRAHDNTCLLSCTIPPTCNRSQSAASSAPMSTPSRCPLTPAAP